MKKTFLAAALTLSLCAPVYAGQFTNTGADIYSSPIGEEEKTYNSDVVPDKEPTTEKVKTKDGKEVKQALPIYLSADH
ncbi:secreted protein, partial [gut metagenome]